MSVPSGVIVAWPSTVASIPANWTRKTAWDAKYIAGAAAGGDAGGTGGAATHTHTSPSHTPTQNSHTHTFSAGASTGTVDGLPLGSDPEAGVGHTHASATSNSATATNNGIAIAVNANSSNDPPYFTVLWIESDGTPTGLPNGGYAFFDSDSLPTSWTRVQGNTYLKGADAGADGGSTGGSPTHIHTSPAHTHTQVFHSHAATTSAATTTTADLFDDTTDTNTASMEGHTHSVTLSNGTATNQSVTTTIDASNGEPEFTKLNTILNGTGGQDLPVSVIALWGGTHAAIPSGWSRVTALDTRFIKGANADGEVLTIGGAQTHTHTASNCQPVQNTHNHSTAVGSGPLASFQSGIGGSAASRNHTHTWTVDSKTATNNSVAVTISANLAKSAYPLYVEAIVIKFTGVVAAVTPRRTLLGVGV